MITKFYATRDLARTVAREEGETFKDMGKDAPKGERWAVLFSEIKDLVENAKAVEMNVPTQDEKALIDGLTAAFAKLDATPVLQAPKHVCRRSVSVMKNHKGANVTVYTKRVIPV